MRRGRSRGRRSGRSSWYSSGRIARRKRIKYYAIERGGIRF